MHRRLEVKKLSPRDAEGSKEEESNKPDLIWYLEDLRC